MTTQNNDNANPQEMRIFTSKEDAIAFLQGIAEPDSIIILTPPPH